MSRASSVEPHTAGGEPQRRMLMTSHQLSVGDTVPGAWPRAAPARRRTPRRATRRAGRAMPSRCGQPVALPDTAGTVPGSVTGPIGISGCDEPSPPRHSIHGSGDRGTGTLLSRSSQLRKGAHVREIHRQGPQGGGPRPGRGEAAQPLLHRHRAHPARAHPRRRGRRRQGAREPRHLPRSRAQPGRGDHRPGRVVAIGAHPVHAPGQEGARALPARGAPARPQLHRHRAHPARPHPRGRGRRRPGAGQARRRPVPRPPAGDPAPVRLPGAGRAAPRAPPPPGPASAHPRKTRRRTRATARSSTSSAATTPSSPASASSTR